MWRENIPLISIYSLAMWFIKFKTFGKSSAHHPASLHLKTDKMNEGPSWLWHLMRSKPREPEWLRRGGSCKTFCSYFNFQHFFFNLCLIFYSLWQACQNSRELEIVFSFSSQNPSHLRRPPISLVTIRLFGYFLMKIWITELICLLAQTASRGDLIHQHFLAAVKRWKL